jgi:acyl carrier protein
VLVKLWTEFMGIDDLGVHDDFSELGGNSLLAARLASRVNDTFSLKCPLNVVFEAPTVAKLSEWLIEHETNPGQTEKIASILLKIESMSAQDISAAITEEKGKRGNA